MAEELATALCLDLTDQEISGGTNPKKDLEEKKVVIKLQYCDEDKPLYQPKSGKCRTKAEIDALMQTGTVSLRVSDNYVDFSEKETDQAIKSRLKVIAAAQIN